MLHRTVKTVTMRLEVGQEQCKNFLIVLQLYCTSANCSVTILCYAICQYSPMSLNLPRNIRTMISLLWVLCFHHVIRTSVRARCCFRDVFGIYALLDFYQMFAGSASS